MNVCGAITFLIRLNNVHRKHFSFSFIYVLIYYLFVDNILFYFLNLCAYFYCSCRFIADCISVWCSEKPVREKGKTHEQILI